MVTYNVHAGVDGYGRANNVIDSAVDLLPDLLFAQEVWRGEQEDQYANLRDRLGLQGQFVALGAGERVTGETGGRGWQSPVALLRGEDGLYFDERRELTAHQKAKRMNARGREEGIWGVALLTTIVGAFFTQWSSPPSSPRTGLTLVPSVRVGRDTELGFAGRF